MEKIDVTFSASPATHSDNEFPDGGFKAWVVVLGVFFIYFSTWGYINSWGVFQAYYQQTILHHASPSQISWIGSLQHCLIFLPGVLTGRLFDIGFFRIPYATGSALIIVPTFLVPICKVYWQLVLCQGVAIGLGCGLVLSTSITIVAHWWKKRLGLALGISASGAGLGGTFFPIVIRQLLAAVGFAWTLRIIGFLLMFALGIANSCVARRLPPTRAKGGLFNIGVFRNAAFTLYCIGSFIVTLGFFTISTYISTSTLSIGLSRNFAFYLVAIINGSSTIGRCVCGFLGDRFGPLNVIISTTFVIGITTFAWPFCRTVASLAVVSVLYGFSVGGFTALGSVATAVMGGKEDLGRRIGTQNTFLGLGALCGPPLGGLFNSTAIGYKAVGFFGGSMVLLAICFCVAARLLAAPALWCRY
ncbi:MFS general substrate transporter [Mycena crocata]|nr:MFS general substrate transporter [Mycena crocata]